MGYSKVGFKWLYELKNRYFQRQEAEAIELGSSDVTCSLADVADFYLKNGLRFKASQIKNYTQNGRISIRFFYQDLGFKHLDIIDIDGCHEAFIFDLNTNIQSEYSFYRKYDLVQNMGTGEHCFNQSALFENVHNLAKVNGIITHVGPISCGHNHGMFHIQPQTYFDIAHANNYKILEISIFINRRSSSGLVYTEILPYNEDTLQYIDESHRQQQAGYVLGCYVVMRKIYNCSFKIPKQGEGREIISDLESEKVSKERSLFIKIEFDEVNKVAILGSGKNAQVAFSMAKTLHLDIMCIIANSKDNKEFMGIPVVSFQEYRSLPDKDELTLLAGPNQKIDDNLKSFEKNKLYQIGKRAKYLRYSWIFPFLKFFLDAWEQIDRE